MVHTKQLSDDVQWIYQCHDERGKHLHASQYLVRAGDRHILIDAGSGHVQKLVDVIDEATDHAGLDGVFLTHSILPHTQNLSRIQTEWDDLTVISAAPIPELLGIHDAQSRVLNDTEEVFGQRFTFIDPLLTDVVISSWIFDHNSGVLFTAEGVGHYHTPGDCSLTAADMDDGVEFQHIHDFHVDKLTFLEYVDVTKLRKAFDAIQDRFDIEFIAPMHGNPIEASEFDAYVANIERSVEEFDKGSAD